MTKYPFIYLASPYSHPDAKIRNKRYKAALAACKALWKSGVGAYVPIAYTHPIAVHVPTVRDHEYQVFDDRILAIADELWVLQLEGWEKSQGVQHEVRLAETLDKHIRYVPPDHLQ